MQFFTDSKQIFLSHILLVLVAYKVCRAMASTISDINHICWTSHSAMVWKVYRKPAISCCPINSGPISVWRSRLIRERKYYNIFFLFFPTLDVYMRWTRIRVVVGNVVKIYLQVCPDLQMNGECVEQGLQRMEFVTWFPETQRNSIILWSINNILQDWKIEIQIISVQIAGLTKQEQTVDFLLLCGRALSQWCSQTSEASIVL